MSLGLITSEFQMEPLIPIDKEEEALKQIESALKLKIDDQGIMATITISDNLSWKIYIKCNRPKKTARKLSHLDIYVIDEAKIVGESQAAVVLGQNLLTKQTIAIKIQKPQGPSFEEDLKHERENLAAAGRLFGYSTFYDENVDKKKSKDAQDEAFTKSATHYTFMRYFAGINLIDHLYEIKKPTEKDKQPLHVSKKILDDLNVARLAVKALQELLFMHKEAKLMHRDIKTANFIVSSGALKLIDLGSAVNIDAVTYEHNSTFGYLPPEQCPGNPRRRWTFDCDLWQIGIVIAEIMTKNNYQAELQKITTAYVSMDQIKAIMNDIFAPVDPNADPLHKALLHLIKRCTSELRLERPLKGLLEEEINKLNLLIQTKENHVKLEKFKLRKESLKLGLNQGRPTSSPQLNSSVRDLESLPEMTEDQIYSKLQRLQLSLERLSQQTQIKIEVQRKCTMISSTIAVIRNYGPDQIEERRRGLQLLTQYARYYQPSEVDTEMNKKMAKLQLLMSKIKL